MSRGWHPGDRVGGRLFFGFDQVRLQGLHLAVSAESVSCSRWSFSSTVR
jgi:hypothetical protein